MSIDLWPIINWAERCSHILRFYLECYQWHAQVSLTTTAVDFLQFRTADRNDRNIRKKLKNLPPHLWFNLTFTYRYVKNFVHFLKNHFQLTANYYWTISRWDSDVVHPYGQFCSGKKSSSDVNAIIANKTKLVAWIVSNCGGERFNYVTELQKYIKVDIYGKCGPLKNCSGNCSKQVYHWWIAFRT